MVKENRLSRREQDVLKHLLQGKSNKLIAGSLGISVRTVEFHLKNIYTKFQVSSRMELVLKLKNPTGEAGFEDLGYSTVDHPGKNTENKGRYRWFKNCINPIFQIGKEPEMKQLFNTKHILVGIIAAVMTGSLWVALLQHFGHGSLNAIAPWIIPIVIILTVIGWLVGWVGKRNGNTLIKVFFSALFGTGLGAFAMIPIVGFVIYPLAKLVERFGLINRPALSTDVTSALVILAMIVVWLIAGTGFGIIPLFVMPRKSGQMLAQR